MRRRQFLKFLSLCLGILAKPRVFLANSNNNVMDRTGEKVEIFRSVNGEPAENIRKIVELMGGLDRFIRRDDIVLIKPNGQWWNQGCTNLACIKSFVDEVFSISGGFDGEVVVAENCHRGAEPWNSTESSWAHDFVRNSDVPGCRNLVDLTTMLKEIYGDQFTTVHWINVGSGAQRVYGEENQEGYVYCDGSNGTEKLFFSNGLEGNTARTTIATYPVFRTDRGTFVDFMRGVVRNGSYEKEALKFINFPGLNHHSAYCGMTSCIKNYMGVTDLSGGPDPYDDGQLVPGISNYHSFPFNKWAKGPVPGMLGAEMGFFMNNVRKADINIVAAQWTGLSTRTELPAALTQIVMASTDPVALDYHSAKYVLYPNSGITFHDPDWKDGPLFSYLEACSKMTGDILDESKVEVLSWDVKKDRIQDEEELIVRGQLYWGSDPKQLAKYAVLRFFPFFL